MHCNGSLSIVVAASQRCTQALVQIIIIIIITVTIIVVIIVIITSQKVSSIWGELFPHLWSLNATVATPGYGGLPLVQ